LRKVLDRLEDIRSDRSILAGLAGQPASPEAFDALATRLENVERVLAQRIRRPSAAGSGDRRRESRGPKHREAAEPQTIINRISATLVNREEYERLAEQIADFETILQLRLPDSTPSPDSPPPGNGP
jgi:hypothetical protein